MQMDQTFRTFRTDEGRTLSYVESGDGPLVVMLPGGPGMDPPTYFAAADLPGLRRLVFCPRGTGRSDPAPTPDGYHIAGYVRDLEQLRRQLDAPLLRLYGNSHGAMTALAYAGAHPGRVDRMVLVNGPARMDAAFTAAVERARARFLAQVPDARDRLAAADAAEPVLDGEPGESERRAAFRTFMSRYVARLGEAETAYLDRLCAAPMRWEAVGPMYAELEGGLDLLRTGQPVTVPTLVVSGELDVTVPTEHMRLIADALPAARFVPLAGVGHFVEVEAPDRWATLVGGFLRGDGGVAAGGLS